MGTQMCGHMPAPVTRQGWTLTELLLVVAILGILSALAIPAYQQQQRSVRRGDARAALQQLLFDQARYRANHNQFAITTRDLGWPHDQSPQGLYRIRITEATAEGYIAEATPVGTQAGDTSCSPMRVAWRDAATVIYSSGVNPDSDPGPCWR